MSSENSSVKMPELGVVRAFVILHLFGAVGFTLIIFLSQVVDRENGRLPTWRGFCVSFIVCGLSYTLLVPAGMQFSARPNVALCTAQASLIYAAPPLVVNATLMLIIQLRSLILCALHKIDQPISKAIGILITAIPWGLWAINVLGILLYALKNPKLVEMNHHGTYCHLQNPLISKIVSAWLSVVCLTIIGLEASLVSIMYRHGFRLSSLGIASRAAIRVGVFLLQAVANMAVAIVFVVTNDRSVYLDILIAIQPTLAAIIFGTKTSLFRIWPRKKHPRVNVPSTSADVGGTILMTSSTSNANFAPVAAKSHNSHGLGSREEV